MNAYELLKDAYDLHMHAAPSPFNRLMDDYGLVQQADEAGMAGIMLKSHYEPTAARAHLVNSHSGVKAQAYGGIVLNWPVGGLNPYAAENALKRDAKIVWMPTRDSSNSLVFGDMPGDFFKRPGICALDANGELKPEVLQILDIVKKYDGALATGHLDPEEGIKLCEEGCKRGVRMVLTHPEWNRTVVSVEIQKKLADMGVWIEKCWYNIAEKNCSAEDMAAHIRAVGAEHCFMSTDRGQKGRENPAEAMRMFISTLLEQGITEDEIRTMVHTVPRIVLGLDK